MFDHIAKMKRVRLTTKFKPDGRDHFAGLRQSEWHNAQITSGGAAQLLAGQPLDLNAIGLYLDQPDDFSGPCPRTPYDMNRRVLVVARWHTDPAAAVRRHAQRIAKRAGIDLKNPLADPLSENAPMRAAASALFPPPDFPCDTRPMKPFTHLTGTAAPLPIANIDTDQIIPKQFLKTVSREGLARGLFYDFKTRPDGSPDPDFVLNKPAYAHASILIAKENFGCGSSREHAPWALLDQGLTAVIAPSFADIFYNNCFKNGLLPIILPREVVDQLMEQAGGPNHMFNIDLAAQTVVAPDGKVHQFDIDQGRKASLLAGLDDIGETLQRAGEISVFEDQRRLSRPWLA